MTRHRGLFLFCAATVCASALVVVLGSCGADDGAHADGDGDSGSDGDDDGHEGPSGDDEASEVCPRPFRDDWRVEHEGAFEGLDDSGEPRILGMTIGTPDPFGDNFLNRGDVIVDFTGEPGTIRVELRRFTFACDDSAAADVFAKLSLWAYDESTATPKRPAEMDPASDCRDGEGGWRDGCAIYVYYDGQNQLERAGADIRVTLPPDYRQSLDILTSDNIVEDSYPNRGNVCIDGLHGSADIELASGIAHVRMAADATPAPACPPDKVADCTDVGDPTTIAASEGAWSKNCACATQLMMGSVSIEADAPYAADIVVDAPADLWASITAENEAGGGGADTCPVAIEDYGGAFVPDAAQHDPAEPWRLIGDANRPSEAALAGGGYAVHLVSAACDPVAAVESPDAWEPDVEVPSAETRGFISLCSGCLGDDPCADLAGG
jgi:hypothetical protein